MFYNHFFYCNTHVLYDSMGNGNIAFVSLYNWEGLSLQKRMRTFAELKVTGMSCHVKKTEQRGAFHLKSSAVNVAQAGLKYHIFVAVE